MNKLVVSIAVGAAIVLGVLVFVRGDDVSSAPPLPPGDLAAPSIGRAPLIVECFELIDGNTPSEDVRLVTNNFGGDVVTVDTAIMMCEGAEKERVGATAFPPLGIPGRFVFECFRLEEGANPSDPFVLRTANFGNHSVIVREAVVMCEGAKKEHTNASGATSTLGTAGNGVWECYRIETTVEQTVPVILTTVNFGRDEATVAEPILMCEEAMKHTADPAERDIGIAGGLVWECFLLRSELVLEDQVTLTTHNFGEDEATVRVPVMMCERARKIHVFSFSTVEPFPTPTHTPRAEEPTPTPD